MATDQQSPVLLLIDDDPLSLDLIRRALGASFHILHADQGERGLALVATAALQCVLLAARLPDMDGLEFLARLEPGQADQSALIILTHPDTAGLAIDCLRQGARDILTKGRFGPADLRAAIDQCRANLNLRAEGQAQRQAVHAVETRVAEERAELERAEAKLRSLFDLLPVGISITNPDGHLIDCNPAAERILGLRRDAHLARDFDGPEWRILRPDGSPMPSAEYASVRAQVEGHPVYDVEMGVTTPSGVRWILVSAMPTGNPEDGVVIVYVDITERRRTEEHLRLLQAIVEASEEAIAISNPQGELVYINPAHERLFGRTLEEARGANYRDYYPPASVAILDQEVAPALERGESWEGELDVLDRAGRCFPLWERAGSLRDAQNRLCFAFGFMHDISERRAVEQRLRQLTDRLQLATAAGELGIWDYDLATAQLSWTAHQAVLLGLPPDTADISLKALRARIHPDDRHAWFANLRQSLRTGAPFAQDYRVIWPNGAIHWLHSHGQLTHDAKGAARRLIGTSRDICALKARQQQLEDEARRDALTGLANRSRLQALLSEAMTAADHGGPPLALVYIDLDGFKAINDSHGHDTGDQLLIALARRLQNSVRGIDTLARLGGDEFAVVLIDPGDQDHLKGLLERLLAAASGPVEIGARRLRVSASLGLTFYPQTKAMDRLELLNQADQAMYQAKQAGKNRYRLFLEE